MMKFVAACVSATVICAMAPRALKAADPDGLCPRQNATIHGTYMSHGTGTVVGVGPVSAVGTITYDGHGNLTNPFTLSVNGAVSRITQTGSYTVNRDCTGTVVQGGAHYDFVVAPDASTVFWMETDAGTIVTGTAVRMKPTDAEDARIEVQSRRGRVTNGFESARPRIEVRIAIPARRLRKTWQLGIWHRESARDGAEDLGTLLTSVEVLGDHVDVEVAQLSQSWRLLRHRAPEA